MNHRHSEHSQTTWSEINPVGRMLVELESTDYFTLSFKDLALTIHEICPQISTTAMSAIQTYSQATRAVAQNANGNTASPQSVTRNCDWCRNWT
jgi:hypothetical protein